MIGEPSSVGPSMSGDRSGGDDGTAPLTTFTDPQASVTELDEAPPRYTPPDTAAETGEDAFLRTFGDDEACLDWLMRLRFGTHIDCPKCGRNARFHKLRQHPAYACQWCGCHLHPTAGTRFARSRIGLRPWFHAIYLFSNGGTGPSARQLQRTLGVTYKTAWRMRNAIVDAKFDCANAGSKEKNPDFDTLLSVLLSPAN